VTTVTWSPQSIRDVESIRAFIAQGSVAYAELVVRRIVAAVERLSVFPESGRIVPERGNPEIRDHPHAVLKVLFPRTDDFRLSALGLRGVSARFVGIELLPYTRKDVLSGLLSGVVKSEAPERTEQNETISAYEPANLAGRSH
jgi:toxin ParE1/3/4